MPRRGGKRTKRRTHVAPPPPGAQVLLPGKAGQGGATTTLGGGARGASGAGVAAPAGASAGAGAAAGTAIPRSFVVRLSSVSAMIGDLVQDMRKLMSPYTAARLKERKFNRPRDFAQIAQHFGVTHLMGFSETDRNVMLRVARIPGGPTLQFRVRNYTLSTEVRATHTRQFDTTLAFQHAPFLVLNNFSAAEGNHMQLAKVLFQNMVPAINVETVKLDTCKRIVLIQYDKERDVIEWRHYGIRTTVTGVNRNVRKLVEAKLPNMRRLRDISDFIASDHSANLYEVASDSEAEDEAAKVTLPEQLTKRQQARADKKARKQAAALANASRSTAATAAAAAAAAAATAGEDSHKNAAVKLVELGPRLTLELVKVEKEYFTGDVLYHRDVHKTESEVREIQERRSQATELKRQRREEQEKNVQRRDEQRAAKKRRRLERQEERAVEEAAVAAATSREEQDDENEADNEDDDSDDEIYYAGDDDADEDDGDEDVGSSSADDEDDEENQEDEDDG